MGIKLKCKAIGVYDKGSKVEIDALKGDSWTPSEEDLESIAQSAAEKVQPSGGSETKKEWLQKKVTVDTSGNRSIDILFDDVVSEIFLHFYSPMAVSAKSNLWYPRLLDESGNLFTAKEFSPNATWTNDMYESYAYLHIKHEDGLLSFEISQRTTFDNDPAQLNTAPNQSGRIVQKKIKGMRLMCASSTTIEVGTYFDITYR